MNMFNKNSWNPYNSGKRPKQKTKMIQMINEDLIKATNILIRV
jgi:hypothetical protein